MAWLTIAAVIAVAFLGWNLYRRFGADRTAEWNDGHRTTSCLAPGDVTAQLVSAA
jgi:hypothetical protein